MFTLEWKQSSEKSLSRFSFRNDA